jgi:hypothetical protein
LRFVRTRRQRLIARTAAAGGGAAVILTAVLLLRPEPALYVPGESLVGLTESLGREVPADYPRTIRFVDAARQAGVRFRHFHGTRSQQLPEDMGSGAAWADYDGDGDIDLYAVNEAGPLTFTAAQVAASPAHNALFRNAGDGTFADVSGPAGVDHRGCGQAAAWGDYDGDGRPDLCVSNYGRTLLYRNGASGGFVEVSADTGVHAEEGFWSDVSWADYDGDGDLDLYVCGYVQYVFDAVRGSIQTRQYDALIPASLNPSTYRPERNLLFRNDGGRFAEVGVEVGIDNPSGRSLSASWCDFDADGRTDVYVANDLSDNALFRNNGDGTFADVSHASWVADYRGAMGLAVGDWDSDGDEDLFVTHWIAQENALYANMIADYRAAGMDAGAALRFTDVADQFGVGQIALDYVGWGTVFADVDNDSRLDIIVVNGSTFQQRDDPSLLVPMPLQLFWNKGRGDGFYEVGQLSGAVFQRHVVGRGLAVADYDADGDVDAFVNVNGGEGMLLRNELSADGGNWLEVEVRGGARSNRDGIGARLRLIAQERRWIRQVGASSSYYSQHALSREHFGLGAADLVDTLEVIWPSGLVERYTGVDANQTLVLTEGDVPDGLAGGATP